MVWNSGYEQSCASVCFLQQTKPKDVSHYFPLYKTLRTSLKKKKKKEFSPSYKFQKENLHRHIPRDNDDIEFASKSVLSTGVRCTPFVARVQLPPSPKSNDQKETKERKRGSKNEQRRKKIVRPSTQIPSSSNSWRRGLRDSRADRDTDRREVLATYRLEGGRHREQADEEEGVSMYICMYTYRCRYHATVQEVYARRAVGYNPVETVFPYARAGCVCTCARATRQPCESYTAGFRHEWGINVLSILQQTRHWYVSSRPSCIYSACFLPFAGGFMD